MSVKSSLKAVSALIAATIKSGASFYANLEKAIAGCVDHAREYHDVTPFKSLINGLAENVPGFAANSLVQYIKTQCPVEFEYSPDKKSIENVKEARDKDGNLKKAYPTTEILQQAPFSQDKAMQTRTTTEIEPISSAWLISRVQSFKNQLNKAAEKDGRGVFGGMRGDKAIALHKGDPGFDQEYAKLSNMIQGLEAFAKNVLPMERKNEETKAPAAVTAAAKKHGGKTRQPLASKSVSSEKAA